MDHARIVFCQIRFILPWDSILRTAGSIHRRKTGWFGASIQSLDSQHQSLDLPGCWVEDQSWAALQHNLDSREGWPEWHGSSLFDTIPEQVLSELVEHDPLPQQHKLLACRCYRELGAAVERRSAQGSFMIITTAIRNWSWKYLPYLVIWSSFSCPNESGLAVA